MRVEPELPDHPKFLLLKMRVGDFAMEALIRIWGHCQNSQRGERWPKADARYVETIARWTGKSGELFTALRKAGWIEKAIGGIIIHDWEQFNWITTRNWKNGRLGGRPPANPKSPDAKSGLTHEEPTANPDYEHGKPAPDQWANPREREIRESGSTIKEEKKNGHLDPAAVKASAMTFAALNSRLADLESVPAQERSAEMRLEIKKMRAALEEHQKKQAEGKF